MVTATKQFVFDAAHRLAKHEGLCKNIHGHTYQVDVTLVRSGLDSALVTEGPAEGMVIDFKDIKDRCKYVFDLLDHAYIYDYTSSDEIDVTLKQTFNDLDLKMYPFPGRPTAENMCTHFWRNLMDVMPEGIYITRIVVWETPTSYAEYTPR